ncbi:MAG: diaminopimelate decarboxylase family protein, partial [Promethearchaeota archaeon]
MILDNGKFLSKGPDGVALIYGMPWYDVTMDESPVLVLSIRELIENFRRFQAISGEVFNEDWISSEIFYSMKTNPHQEVLEALQESGCGIQVVSEHELDIALKLGFEPEKIIVGGIGKSQAFLRKAIDLEVYCLYLDSIEEIKAVGTILDKSGQKPCVGLSLGKDPRGKMGFNLEHDNVDKFTDVIESSIDPNLIKSIHYHAGTQVGRIDGFVNRTKRIISIMDLLEKNLNIKIEMINLGGGFPESSYCKANDLACMMKKTRDYLIEKIPIRNRKIRVIFEPGRYIIATAGLLFTSVLQIKENSLDP